MCTAECTFPFFKIGGIFGGKNHKGYLVENLNFTQRKYVLSSNVFTTA